MVKSGTYIIKNYTAFIIVIIFRAIFYSIQIPVKLYNDSWSYINYSFSQILDFTMTNGRTPLYPFLLRINYWIWGEEYYLNIVVALQICFSIVAVFFFYKIAELFLKSSTVINLLTILYGCNTAICGYDKAILTESFALSSIVIMVYFLLRYIQQRGMKYAYVALTIAFLILFLRPSFLLYYVLIAGCLILRMIFNIDSKHRGITLVIIGVESFLILLWCWLFKQSFGYFSLSDPIPRQYLIRCLQEGFYLHSNNSEFVEVCTHELLKAENDAWGALYPIMDHFGGGKYILEITKECFANAGSEYREFLIELMLNQSKRLFEGYYELKPESTTVVFQIKMCIYNWVNSVISSVYISHAYFICVLDFGFLIREIWKKKRISWIGLGLFSFIFLTIISSYLATCGEYMRTMICVLPLLFISVLWICGNDIEENIVQKNLLNKKCDV